MVIGRKGFGVIRRRRLRGFADGTRVRERKTGQVGTVVKAGVQVSEVRWDEDGKETRFVVNEWLDPL